jgi:hypothetical protein
VFHGTLLVVMPNGFGVARVGAGPAAALQAVPAPGAALGTAAIAAVQRLAAAAGHRLPAPRGATSSQASAHSATGVVAWLAFAVGAILIAVAWTISLRQRPPRRGDGVASPHGT